jgi:hypothetical protein
MFIYFLIFKLVCSYNCFLFLTFIRASKTTFDARLAPAEHSQGKNVGIGPNPEEKLVQSKIYQGVYDDSLKKIHGITASPFEESGSARCVPKGYPLLPPKDFRSEKEKRVSREEKRVHKIVTKVESEAEEMSRIVTKVCSILLFI